LKASQESQEQLRIFTIESCQGESCNSCYFLLCCQ